MAITVGCNAIHATIAIARPRARPAAAPRRLASPTGRRGKPHGIPRQPPRCAPAAIDGSPTVTITVSHGKPRPIAEVYATVIAAVLIFSFGLFGYDSYVSLRAISLIWGTIKLTPWAGVFAGVVTPPCPCPVGYQ